MSGKGWFSAFISNLGSNTEPTTNSNHCTTQYYYDDPTRQEDSQQYYWNKRNCTNDIHLSSAPAVQNATVAHNILNMASKESNSSDRNKSTRSNSASSESRKVDALGSNRNARPGSSVSKNSSKSEQRSPILVTSQQEDLNTVNLPNRNALDSYHGHCRRVVFNVAGTSSNDPYWQDNSNNVMSPISCEHTEVGYSMVDHPTNDSFKASPVKPIYERPRAAPTRATTPLQENESAEKRVRFLETEVVGEECDRPGSGTSTYSNITKNSKRYSFTPDEVEERDIYSIVGHSSRICSCPCHFFPKRSHSIGVQVIRSNFARLPQPRKYRLFVIPSMNGLDDLPSGSRITSIIVRSLLSQVGLCFVVMFWWLIGSLIFSTMEKPLQQSQVDTMAIVRKNLVIDLATELRQVSPFDLHWRIKIEEYLLRFENVLLKAVKGGYHSNKVSWTLTDSFLYAASLTLMLGPGRLVVQSNVTRVFSLIYSMVGIPIVFVLLINMAQTVREGLNWLWTWKKRHKVAPREATPQEIRTQTMNMSIEEKPSYIGTPQSRSHTINISRVPNLESPRCSSSASSDNESRTNDPPDVRRSSQVEASSSQLQLRSSPQHNSNPQVPAIVVRKEHKVPWFVLAIFPLCYFALGSSVLIYVQRWSAIPSMVIVWSNLLFTDHGGTGIDNSQQTLQNWATLLYTFFTMLGALSSMIVILGTWQDIYLALVNTGLSLSVVKTIILAR